MAEGWELRRSSADAEPPGAGGPHPVVVKVRSPGYVPTGFFLRSRVDDYLFTANADARAIDSAAHDPEIESVSRGRRLRPQDDEDRGSRPNAPSSSRPPAEDDHN